MPEELDSYSASDSRLSISNSAQGSADLSTADWLMAIFCSGIGCMIGIIRLINGDPRGGKLLGVSLLFPVLLFLLRLLLGVLEPIEWAP